MTTNRRHLPIGAEHREGEGTHFRVWAPAARRIDLVFEDAALAPLPLQREGNGYFIGQAAQARPGTRYRFRLDGGDAFPDPASRWQPEGPHGPSQVVDATAYLWNDEAWR